MDDEETRLLAPASRPLIKTCGTSVGNKPKSSVIVFAISDYCLRKQTSQRTKPVGYACVCVFVWKWDEEIRKNV